MNGILEIFQSISNTEIPNLKNYINALSDHQTFRLNDISNTNAAVQRLNELLSKPETRFKGLLLLKPFIEQTSLDILEQKGNIWANSCLKICLKKTEDIAIPYAYDTLSLLIEKSVHIPELTKSFHSSLISKICETFAYCQSKSYSAALKCLENILRLYPAQCGGNTRGIIEKFLLKLIDLDDISLIYLSGKCYQLLQQVRTGSAQGVSQKTAWQNYQIQLLGSLHALLNLLYANCPETYDESTINQELMLPALELSNEPVERAAQLAKRFKNITTYLIIAIREPFPVSKIFSPEKILNLISRGLAVNSDSARKNPISDNIAIGALLPDIHVHLFKLLDSLISVLKTHLALYYKNILGLILNSLKWTSTGKSCGFSKPYKSLRIVAYNTLMLWCKTMKFGSCVEIYFENLLKFINDDISPFQNELTLQVLSGAKKHMSKKARKQLHKAQNEKSHLAQTHSKSNDIQNIKTVYSDYDNQVLCYNALECLKEILIYGSTFLKPIMIKETQIILVQISIHLKEIFSSSPSTKSVLLYANPICRQKLYDVLHTIVMAPHHLCPPPAQLIIHLLAQSQNIDPSPLVRDICAKNLQSLEKIMHPQKECLYFPPDIHELKDALKNNHKTIEGYIARDETSDEEEYSVVSDSLENNILKNSEFMEIQVNGKEDTSKVINKTEQNKQSENLLSIEINDEPNLNDVSIIISDENGEESEIEEIRIDTKSGKRHLDLNSSNKRKTLEVEINSDSNEDDNVSPVVKKICVNEILISQNDDNGEENEFTLSENHEKLDDDTLLTEMVSTFVDELNTH